MIKKNVWHKFCADRQMDPGSLDDLKKTYTLTPHEVAGLGLAPKD